MRAEGDALIRAAGVYATLLRAWCVLGTRAPLANPGVIPVYALLERLPPTRDGTLEQILAALVGAVEHPVGDLSPLSR